MIEKLNNAFTQLPGVGKKTAQRFTYYLLQRNRNGGLALADALDEAMRNIKHCEQCQTLSQHSICDICQNPKRNRDQLCVVENPTDIVAIEHTQSYQGLYFVLSGYLSPIDGIDAEQLGLDSLVKRLTTGEIKEVILATNSTLEGEVTARYLKNIANEHGVNTTRLAHGIPLGGELEYTDSHTLAHALAGRQHYE